MNHDYYCPTRLRFMNPKKVETSIKKYQSMWAVRLQARTRPFLHNARYFYASHPVRSSHPYEEHYKVLGVDSGTSFAEVKKAYTKVGAMSSSTN